MRSPEKINLLASFAVAIALVSIFSACTSSRHTMQSLTQHIQKELSAQEGVYAVAFKDLGTGKIISINGDSLFHAASTMKTPVMIEVFKQAAEGKFSLDDSVVLINEFKSIVDGSAYTLDSADDSEQDLYRHLGDKRTVNALLYQMITVSSNFATNLIIGMVDAKNVMKTMRQYGANRIQVLRGVEDNKAFELGLNNQTTANDLALIFEKIAKGEAVSGPASQKMIGILLDQRFNEVIPAKLPPDVKVAHKTGSITGVQHDSGIVFLPDGRKYIIVLLSKGIKNEKASIDAMARVSRMIYDYMMSAH